MSISEYGIAKWNLGRLGTYVDKYKVISRGIETTGKTQEYTYENRKILNPLTAAFVDFSDNPTRVKKDKYEIDLMAIKNTYALRQCLNIFSTTYY